MIDVEPTATIRAAATDDLEDVFELATLMALTFVPERGAFGRSFRSVLDDPSAQLLVADLDGRVGGYLLGFEHVAFFANGPVAWVEEIAVRTHLRRQHLGTRLMSAYEDSVQARGGRLVALATTRAGHFYEALGYTDHAAYYRKTLVGPRTPPGGRGPGAR